MAEFAPTHQALPDGHWWACQRPGEAKPEPFRQHFRPGCERCYVAWRVAAAQPRATFFTGSDPRIMSLHEGHTEAEIRAWFMEGIVPTNAALIAEQASS